MAQSSRRGLGWVPDVPSIKDYTETHPEVASKLAKTAVAHRVAPAAHSAAGGRGAAAAPARAPIAKVDLRAHFSPIEDQGELGSCTAHAAVGLIEYMERRALGKHIDASRLFVYKVTRNLMRTTGDSGAEIRTALGAIACFGAPPERYWPYDGRREEQNTNFDKEPSAFCYAFASSFQAIKYLRMDPANLSGEQVLVAVKSYLASGLPSMFGLPVYDEFQEPAKNLIAFPKPMSKLWGGHAILAAGYDDKVAIGGDRGALLIRNSWSTSWGDQGYAWLSYRYVTEGLAVDWWTVLKQDWVDTGQFQGE